MLVTGPRCASVGMALFADGFLERVELTALLAPLLLFEATRFPWLRGAALATVDVAVFVVAFLLLALAPARLPMPFLAALWLLVVPAPVLLLPALAPTRLPVLSLARVLVVVFVLLLAVLAPTRLPVLSLERVLVVVFVLLLAVLAPTRLPVLFFAWLLVVVFV